jgi:hypothetical protein
MPRDVAEENLAFPAPESIFFFMGTNYSSKTVGFGRAPAGGSPRRPRARQSSAAPATGHTRLELPEQARGRSTGVPRARGRPHQDVARRRRGSAPAYSGGTNRRATCNHRASPSTRPRTGCRRHPRRRDLCRPPRARGAAACRPRERHRRWPNGEAKAGVPRGRGRGTRVTAAWVT